MDRLQILIPIFDDWEALTSFLTEANDMLKHRAIHADILVIDDGSGTRYPGELKSIAALGVRSIEILRLQRNLGHQRAIAVGLAYLSEMAIDCPVVVMDGDGEDRPAHIFSLFEAFLASKRRKIIFAERRKRFESIGFRLGYKIFRWLHLVLVGVKVRVGNFSILPPDAVRRLAVSSELWNHYAAAVFRSRYPYESVALDRGRRYSGRSHMNFASLVTHGLSALSVFGDVVGARLLILNGLIASCVVLALSAVISIRLATDWAIPGWATYAAGIVVMILSQVITVVFGITFLILFTRSGSTFIPVRDFRLFIEHVEKFTLHDEFVPLRG